MTAVLTLASIGDLGKVAPLVAAFHAEEALTTSEPQRIGLRDGVGTHWHLIAGNKLWPILPK